MAWIGFAVRAVAIGAALLLLAACETAPEKMDDKGGGGQQQVTKDMDKGKVMPGSQEDLVLNVGDHIFFDYDQSSLRPDARSQVERWAAWLKKNPTLQVRMEGHCDERGTREYNLALGERRSNSAVKYLLALGISAGRIDTISYGKEKPVCGASNESCWEQNRRGVMVVK